MAKKSDAAGAQGAAGSTITVSDSEKRSSEELMKLPKAQIVREIAVPENTTRFIVDVDNQSKQGKGIIAVMESLRDGNAATTRAVAEILGALAGVVPKKATPKK